MSIAVRHRKQWQLQDGLRGTLHRLRSQLAEDGCSDSQIILAKNLLQESESCIGSFENAEVAVYWLIQSSDQANQEATNLLKHCLRHGKGITDRNYRQVEDCINRSLDEKQFRKAAHDLFCSLTASTDADYVTLRQLKHEAIKVTKGLPLGGALENNHSAYEDHDEYELSLRDVQRVASTLYKGQVPKLSLQEDQHNHTSDKSKFSTLPFKIILDIYDKLLQFSAKQGQYVFIRWFLPTKQFHAIALLFLYSVVTTQTLFKLLPVVLCYISMLVMVVSTLQMLHYRRGLLDLKLWSRILRHFNSLVKASDAESKYCWNSFSPYIQFLVSIIVVVLVLPNTTAPWVPYSEFTVTSLLMTVCSFISLSDKHDAVTNLSMISSIVSSLPQLFSSITLPSYFAFMLSQAHFMSVYLGYGVELNLSVFSVFYVIIVLCCVRLIWDDPIPSSYKVLLPHIICLMWWQITVRFFNHTHIIGLVHTTLQWSILTVTVWVLGWMFTLLILATSTFLIVVRKESYLRIFVTVILILCPLLLTWWTNFNKTNKWLKIAQKYRYMFIIIALGSILSPLLTNVKFSPEQYSKNSDSISVSPLQWNNYYERCHKPAWQRSSMADVEIKCSPLVHTVIEWNGVINLVRIINIDNQLDKFLGILPTSLAHWLRCLYGEDSVTDPEIQELFQKSHSKCHLQKWNKYDFEIVLRMQTDRPDSAPVDIFIDANTHFKKYILKLRRGDEIKVVGILTSDIGGSRPRLNLIRCRCLQCSEASLESNSTVLVNVNVSDKLLAAAQSCFAFFFSPLFKYHPIIPSL